MELQEAKKIYFRLVQDYNTFKKIVVNWGADVAGKKDYLKLGLIPDIAELLSAKDKKAAQELAEEIYTSVSQWWAVRENYKNKMADILENKFLTSKEKDKQAMALRGDIVKEFKKMALKNQQLEEQERTTFKPIYAILEEVEETLAGFTDDEVLSLGFSLYHADVEVLREDEGEQLANQLYRPLPELKDRDFWYYNKIGEDGSYGRHNEKLFKELGLYTDWGKEEYWRKHGYKSFNEWLAINHENEKEKEELAFIEEQKKELAYQQMKQEGKQDGFFKKFLGGLMNETN